MLLAVERDFERLQTRIRSNCGEYDAYPLVSDVVFSIAPLALHPDRSAVAATLAFWRSISGAISFDRGCSPQTAGAIRAFLSPISVHVTSIDLKPSRLAAGHRSGLLGTEIKGCSDRQDLLIRFSEDAVGAYFSPTEAIISSNCVVFAKYRSANAIAAWFPFIAGAMLLSEDFLLSSITIPYSKEKLSDCERASFEAARQLLASCAIHLRLQAE